MATVSVDPLRMTQALTHVLNWALDAAHGAEVVMEVGDRDRPGADGAAGRALVVEVACDAPATGFDEASMFQPFHKVAGVPGLHLALPLARRIIEAHGGTIEPYGAGPHSGPDAAPRLGVRLVLPRPPPATRIHSRPTLPQV